MPAGPQGDLAAWQDLAGRFLDEVESQHDSRHFDVVVTNIRGLRNHLAAMPQAQPDAELLETLRDLLDTSPYQPASHRATVRAREAVAQAEKGAPA